MGRATYPEVTVINIQPIEKRVQREDFQLDVHSIFYTIQGEGPLTGHPAIFIRLAGCNLQCPQCDTDYTSTREALSPEAVMARVRKLHPGPRLVVITGGEPFRQDLSLLVTLLTDEDYMVQIETNGTLAPSNNLPGWPLCWVVVSPKAGKVHPDVERIAVAWKYVLNADSMNPEDGLPVYALDHTAYRQVARPPESFPVGAIYLQPADRGKLAPENELNLLAVIESCMKHGYTLQLQVHKLLNME